MVPLGFEIKVQLHYASIPGILGHFAVHYWFVVILPDETYRFEVWQEPNRCRTSIGHVHCNLNEPEADVGGGPTQFSSSWYDQDAQRIKRVLDEAKEYPFCHTYRYWPGPNSNTFVAWVLRKAGIKHKLGWKAFGQRFPVPQ